MGRLLKEIQQGLNGFFPGAFVNTAWEDVYPQPAHEREAGCSIGVDKLVEGQDGSGVREDNDVRLEKSLRCDCTQGTAGKGDRRDGGDISHMVADGGKSVPV